MNATALVLMMIAVAPVVEDRPTCSGAAWALRVAISRHVTVEAFGPEHARRATTLALELFKEDVGPYLTEPELEAARHVMEKDSLARRAARWSTGNCEEFVRLGVIRAQAIRRMEVLLEDALADAQGARLHAPRTTLEREVHQTVRGFLRRQERFAREDVALRFVREQLARQKAEVRRRNVDWAALALARATVGALDPHSRFLLPREREQLLESLGERVGLFGVAFSADGLTPWGYLLSQPPAGTPGAEPGGLEEGQVLLAIDGVPTVGKKKRELCDWLARKGARVSLEVARIEDGALKDK